MAKGGPTGPRGGEEAEGPIGAPPAEPIFQSNCKYLHFVSVVLHASANFDIIYRDRASIRYTYIDR